MALCVIATDLPCALRLGKSRIGSAIFERLRKCLGGKASPVLYFSGNADLLAGGGMAFALHYPPYLSFPAL